MDKLNELIINDVKELTEGKKVTVSSTENSAISVYIKDAVVVADPDVGTDGKITFFEPESGLNIELDSDKAIETIYGNENIVVITLTNNMGGLDICITSETSKLIHPIPKEYGWKEPVYEDFISREEFINRTGIFVTPEYFEYIYDMEFKKANVTADEFVNNYEKKYSNCIQEVPLNGTFKYEIMDEDLSCMCLYDDAYEPNIWEICNSLAISYAMERQIRWEYIEKYKSALQENVNMVEKIQLLDKRPSEYQS